MSAGSSSSGSKAAVVTGASSGIGKAVVELLRSEGWRVVACGRDLGRLHGALGEAGGDLRFAVGDLATVGGCEDVVKVAKEYLGAWGGVGLDLLVNNAGGGSIGSGLESVGVEAWDWHMNLNVRSAHLLSVGLLEQLRADGGGCVVNVSSIAAVRPLPGVGVYGVAKAALDHLTRSQALEWAPQVRSVNIQPATVATGFHRSGGMSEESLEAYYGDAGAKVHPMGRVGTAAEIAQAVLFAASAPWMTGTHIRIDGGRTLTSATAPQLAKK